MATRMQQRRGTAAQWTSTNAGAGPVLNAGEIGWESDTNRFKIGDGVNNWANLDYFADTNSTTVPTFGTSIVFEGATADSYETTLQVTDPTVDRTITFPDATGTVQLRVTDVSDTEIGYLNGVTSAIQTQLDDKSTASKTETFTNKTLTSPVINTPTGITKTDVGLANVDNTSDANKPVSTAGQTALDLKANLSGATFTGAVSGTSLTLSGDLTVNGTTTNINSTNLVVEDKNIVLGDTAEPADATADGGGITLKGTTDKTFNWVDATDSWTSSEHINLASTKELKINGTSVLSGSTLGSGVTGSSLTSVGTITSGTWTGTTIAIANGGTGQTTASAAANALLPSQTSNSGKYLTTDGAGTLSWGTVSGYSAPTLGSTSIASGSTVTTISGLTLSGATLTGTLTAGGGAGTAGQVLKSTGSGVEWTTPAGGAAFSEFMLIGA
jgi:hypothetical protein